RYSSDRSPVVGRAEAGAGAGAQARPSLARCASAPSTAHPQLAQHYPTSTWHPWLRCDALSTRPCSISSPQSQCSACTRRGHHRRGEWHDEGGRQGTRTRLLASWLERRAVNDFVRDGHVRVERLQRRPVSEQSACVEPREWSAHRTLRVCSAAQDEAC